MRRLAPGASRTSAAKDGVAVKQTVVIATYPVSSNPTNVIGSAERRFDFSWSGKAQKEDGAVKWSGLAIESRVFFRVPDWVSPPKPSADAVAGWNKFAADLERHNAGHMNIFKSAVDSLAQGLSSLRAEDETKLRAQSDSLEKSTRARVAKRQEGFDRHAVQERESPISKKKK